MKNYILSTVLLFSATSFSCPLPSGTYNCKSAKFTEIGKNNIVINKIIISNSNHQTLANWQATGDIWIPENETQGHFERKDFEYNFNLTPGLQLIDQTLFASVTCEVNPAGTQVYWGLFLQNPDESILLVSNIRYTVQTGTNQLHISNIRYDEHFTCDLN